MNLRSEFEKHGWVIIKDFFSDDDIRKIKAGTERSIKESMKVDLLCNPYLNEMTVLNPKIIAVVKELLEGDPVYIGDSSISNKDLAMSLHKDNPDRFDSNAPDWQSKYSVLRIGIYLQDYTEKSGGLILRDKSHLYPTRWKGKVVNVKSSPRDLILWNLRTTHSGNAKRLTLLPNLDLNPYVCKLMPNFMFKATPETRMALFLSYGKDDHHLKRYITYLKTRNYAVDRWKHMQITKELIAQGDKVGLKILDFTEEANKIDRSTVHENHVELKY